MARCGEHESTLPPWARRRACHKAAETFRQASACGNRRQSSCAATREDYITFLEKGVAVPTFSASVNGGAQYTRLMFEVLCGRGKGWRPAMRVPRPTREYEGQRRVVPGGVQVLESELAPTETRLPTV